MTRRNQPYIPLYVQDFTTDEKLNECSAAATGVFIRLMCVMHKSAEYGAILLKQKDQQTGNKISDFALKLTKHMPFEVSTIEHGLTELLDEGVIQIDGDKLFQKRMVKDGRISEIRGSAGKKGSKAQAKSKQNSEFATDFAIAKTQAKSQQNTENEIEIENEIDIKDIKGDEIKDSGIKKIKYAEFVHMTEEEHQKLVDGYGVERTDRFIAKLDNYKGSKGKTYKSDYHAILSWVVAEVPEKSPNDGNPSYQLDKMERLGLEIPPIAASG